MPTKTIQKKPKTAQPRQDVLAPGDRVIVAGAGGEWAGKVSSRRMPDGRESIHPRFDDTTVFVISDDTGISMPVSVGQVSKRGRR
jgi:hypothetical protein